MRFGECCERPGAIPLIGVPNLRPPGAKTGKSHPRCYMRDTQNCSESISREHYISAAVLRQFDSLTIRGFPWQAAGERLGLAPTALASNILCERHNAALSPLDELAGQTFKVFVDAARHAARRSLSRKSAYFLASGDGLELWLTKVLAGLFQGKIAGVDDPILPGSRTLDMNPIVATLSGARLAFPLGLRASFEADFEAPLEIRFAPLLGMTDMTTRGLRVMMRAVMFDLLTDASELGPEWVEDDAGYRPSIIDFVGPNRTSRIVLTWEGQRTSGKRIAIKIEASGS